MADIKIGLSFIEELERAGLMGLPFSWGADGSFHGRENLTDEQNKKLDAVIAKHNPRTPSKIAPPKI